MARPKQKSKSGFFTISEACKFLDVSRQTLYHLRSADLLTAEPTTNGKVYFKTEAVEALKVIMNEHRSMPC